MHYKRIDRTKKIWMKMTGKDMKKLGLKIKIIKKNYTETSHFESSKNLHQFIHVM